ncbi:MAG: accessory Sec system translocase SecA2 [Lachnospiraceae bacterium]|nr:accessory Sec system translocase SecA2 [Lachnospiraceae bacterium]
MNELSSLKKLNKLTKLVRKQCRRYAYLEDHELAELTDRFRERLENGETLDDVMIEAFAAMCEADRRILGKMPYDVQIIGGMAIHQGYLCEMNTGEGKTLMATLPLYLNALSGKSCILVTANEHLAYRDAKEMGEAFNFMGLTVMAGVREKSDEQFTNDEKKEIYAADIVYTTHGTLGFDYLFNNLVKSADERFLREFYFCIIDEADSVLLDAAQMPLVISGSPRVQSNLYSLADFFARTLKENEDYIKEEKIVYLTDKGVKRAEDFFRIDNFYGKEFFEINRHVILALRAHALLETERDYVVSEQGEIVLLDNGSGRMMPGVKLRGGQHQALEIKEDIEASQENRSVASITYQNLFMLFPKMAGMSGTISDASEELLNVYHKRVLVIPPNKPLARIDHRDRFYKTAEEQFSAAIDEVLKIHKTGQPVLVVTSTIGETELISEVLVSYAIPHSVLNANNAYWEAEIIKEAGRLNAVTVATSMAGRGTDIKLGEGVAKLGGLAVIGIGRMPNIRIERQARGRSGRQGDPGSSRFYVSLEDEIFLNSIDEKTKQKFREKKYLFPFRIKKLVNNAQKIGEEQAVITRLKATAYDEVLQKQRSIMYSIRNDLLDGEKIDSDMIRNIAKKNVDVFLDENPVMNSSELNRYILDNISYELNVGLSESEINDRDRIREYLLERIDDSILKKEKRIDNEALLEEFYRKASLFAIDDAWVEQVDYLQQLQSAVAGRTTAQRNSIFEFHKEAFVSFNDMKNEILKNIMRNILLCDIEFDKEGKLSLVYP